MSLAAYPLARPTSSRVPYGRGLSPRLQRGTFLNPRDPFGSRGRLVSYVGSRGITAGGTVPAGQSGMAGLGIIPGIDAIASVVGGIFGASAAKDAAKTSAKYQFKAAEITAQYGFKAAELAAQTARESSRYALQAERERAQADVRRASIEANANVDALRTQRLAAIDAQSAQLVANTQVGIFGLAARGIEAAASQPVSLGRAAVVGAVLVTVAALFAMNPPKLKKRKVGRGRRGASSDDETTTTGVAA